SLYASPKSGRRSDHSVRKDQRFEIEKSDSDGTITIIQERNTLSGTNLVEHPSRRPRPLLRNLRLGRVGQDQELPSRRTCQSKHGCSGVVCRPERDVSSWHG